MMLEYLRLLIGIIHAKEEEEEILLVGKVDSTEWEGEQTAFESQMYEEQGDEKA